MGERKFIAAGSCRRVFSLGDGTCEKVAITERLEAGRMQNEAEYSTLNAVNANGKKYSCFPRAFSSSENFDSIIVECVENAEDFMFDDAFGKYVDMDVVSSKSFKRIDGYQWIAIENSFCKWFAIVFCGFIDVIVDRLNVLACDKFTVRLKSVQDFLNSYSELDNNSKFTHNVEDLVETSSKFLNEIINQKDSNGAFRSLYDLLDFYMSRGKAENFLLADLWSESQWGVRRNA